MFFCFFWSRIPQCCVHMDPLGDIALFYWCIILRAITNTNCGSLLTEAWSSTCCGAIGSDTCCLLFFFSTDWRNKPVDVLFLQILLIIDYYLCTNNLSCLDKQASWLHPHHPPYVAFFPLWERLWLWWQCTIIAPDLHACSNMVKPFENVKICGADPVLKASCTYLVWEFQPVIDSHHKTYFLFPLVSF